MSNQVLKKDIRRKLERVVKSSFYKKLFNDVYVNVSNESEMIMSNGNLVNFITTNSAVPIGAGYHYIFLVDYLSGDTMRSEALRNEAFSQLTGFLSRTQNNPPTKIIVDNQRLGIDDLSAYLTSQYDDMRIPYSRITFPYQFDEDVEYSIKNKTIKFKKGEFLVSRFNDFEKRKIIARLGDFIYEVQYLQKARAPKGDLVKREMFRFYSPDQLKNIKFTKGFITTDLAIENKKRSDYNVFQFWMIDEDLNLYLIDMVRTKMKGLEAEKLLYNFYLKWQDGTFYSDVGCDFISFEDVGFTKMTIDRYKKGFIVDGKTVSLAGLIKELPRNKNKFSRFIDALPHIQAGKIFLPNDEVAINGVFDVVGDIVEPFIREYESFREDMSHDHDDIVDCGSDAINIARKGEINFGISIS